VGVDRIGDCAVTVSIIWADGRKEETQGEEIVQDGLFVRVLGKRSKGESESPTIRLIRREKIRMVSRVGRVIRGIGKGEE